MHNVEKVKILNYIEKLSLFDYNLVGVLYDRKRKNSRIFISLF